MSVIVKAKIENYLLSNALLNFFFYKMKILKVGFALTLMPQTHPGRSSLQR